ARGWSWTATLGGRKPAGGTPADARRSVGPQQVSEPTTTGLAKKSPELLFPGGSRQPRRSPHERPNEAAGAGAAEAARGTAGLPAVPPCLPAPRSSGNAPAAAAP